MSKPSDDAVDRETLYEQVWTDPVKVVAQRYGLSDVGLAKICRKLHIPIPSRGYWAKVKAGRVMKKVPLPPLRRSGSVPSGPTPLSREQLARRAAIRESVAKVKQPRPKLEVSASLIAPHPLVRAAEKRLKQQEGWETSTGLRTAPKEVLHLEVTRGSLDRALRLADTFLKALEVAGMTVQVDANEGKTVLDSAGTQVNVTITEKITQTEHILTRSEKRAQDLYNRSFLTAQRVEYPRIPRFDYHPTGRLTISVGRWRRRNWNDTERTGLEERMSEVVAGVVALLAGLRAEDEERERRVAQARYEQEMRRREDERRRLGALRREAVRFRRAAELRQYIAAVDEAARRAGELSAAREEWIAWARAKADWIDPLVQVSDVILDAPEPKRPDCW